MVRETFINVLCMLNIKVVNSQSVCFVDNL